MCMDPGTAIVLASLAITAAGVAGTMGAIQTKQNNEYQEQQFKRVEKAAKNQYAGTVERQRLEAQRQAQDAFKQAQAQQIDNLRKMGAAEANGATAGATGLALSQVTSDFQRASGGISTNLSNTMKQLNENLFFGEESARLGAQNTINQATPQKGSVAGAFWTAGLSSLAQSAGSAASGISLPAKTPKLNTTPSIGAHSLGSSFAF